MPANSGLPPFHKRDVGVHAGAVIGEQRLGHEGDGFVVLLGDVLDDVLVDHDLIAHADQFVELHIDFALAGSGDFVMLGFDIDAAIDHGLHHFVADVHQGVGRRHGEVAFLVADLVAEVGILDATTVPFAFDAIEMVVAFVWTVVESDVVEDEELGFGADEAGVGDAGALKVVDGFAGDVAGVAGVIFAGDGVLDVADHHERGERGERIDEGGFGLGDDEHIALVNRLPSADAGAVEAEAVFENVFVELVDGDGEMLPEAGKIHETQIDGLHIFLAAQSQHFFGLHSNLPFVEIDVTKMVNRIPEY